MKKLLKIFLWIALFPFMLTYWGWKSKKKPVMAIGAILSLLFIVIGIIGQEPAENPVTDNPIIVEQLIDQDDKNTSTEVANVNDSEKVSSTTNQESNQEQEIASEASSAVSDESQVDDPESNKTVAEVVAHETPLFDGYKLIYVDGGDLSGHREANVVVDIGFGDREYWAFTNEYGQLVKVIADQIILQDDTTEPVTSEGRYYPDEAKVPGTEASDLDEGHVIADSLGGVANAYNITPQNSTLNRHGDQAYMEKVIREAGGCTNFIAIIKYPDTITQIPSHYSFTYTLMGNVINDEFDNIDPDKANATLNENPTDETTSIGDTESNSSNVVIASLDKKAEFIVIKNTGIMAVNLSGWKIRSVKGDQYFTFPDYTLESNTSVKVGDSASNNDVDFHWLDGRGTWNNSDSDPAELYDNNGVIVDRLDD